MYNGTCMFTSHVWYQYGEKLTLPCVKSRPTSGDCGELTWRYRDGECCSEKNTFYCTIKHLNCGQANGFYIYVMHPTKHHLAAMLLLVARNDSGISNFASANWARILTLWRQWIFWSIVAAQLVVGPLTRQWRAGGRLRLLTASCSFLVYSHEQKQNIGYKLRRFGCSSTHTTARKKQNTAAAQPPAMSQFIVWTTSSERLRRINLNDYVHDEIPTS